MSSSTSERSGAVAAAAATYAVPVAGPPRQSSATQKGSSHAAYSPDWSAAYQEPAWTPAALKGWAGSVSLHALLLLTLALWYFAPPIRRAIHINGRLAGSQEGVPDGLNLKGGLNTALEMPEMTGNQLEAATEPLLELKPTALEPVAPAARGAKAAGGGGLNNPNPGAGDGDGFGLARFGDGGELIRGVAVKVGDPQFTLIWDSDADLDLHVIEPGGKEIYWEDPKGKQGGELDVDNTKGFGPENIYWLVESDGPGSAKVKGTGPAGLYQWFVVYWGGFGGIPKPTHWKVRIKHDGKITVINGKFRALNERSRTYTLKVDLPGPRPATADAANNP
jgi:hypothetical protein